MMKKIVNLLFPVIFVFCSISPSLSQNWGGNRASSVVVETPIRENLATTKEISAKVVSSISYTVSASSNGFVLMENIKITGNKRFTIFFIINLVRIKVKKSTYIIH